MFMELFTRHLVTLFLILLFSIKLLSGKSIRNTATNYFWMTVISCLLLVVLDILEIMASWNPAFRLWRILFSVLGYTFRSTAVLGLLLVVVPSKKYQFALALPSILMLLASGSAFFTDIVFGFNERYEFYRGPLGYIVFVTPVLYMLLILAITFRKFTEKREIERYIPSICALFCLTAAMTGVIGGGVHLNEAIMITSVFFYLVLYSHDIRRDPTTGLLNRQAFYDDCAAMDRRIRAVVSLDMNGLKALNDSRGHQAGDVALEQIGKCIRAVTDKDTAGYRIGGDEFIILFFHDRQDVYTRVENHVKAQVVEHGLTISTGCAIREEGQDLNKLIVESDRRMYADKASYYRMAGHDRRQRASDRH